MPNETILVVAPNNDGRKFVKLLMHHRLSFAVLTNSSAEEKQFAKQGVEQIIRIDTSMMDKWVIPKMTVGRIFVFESSLNLTCRYLQICRSWTESEMYVITRQMMHPRCVYQRMGADHVIYTKTGEVGFILHG
ncbi:hypothetical protein OIN60_20320 [Paenibacillus sp. P96]|uniref:Uncharacterized protein n=1 Tax=Paenibacillus zeirhizosphaerae TaxID=2987519 RepID=A0ABT9FWH0_9BACL|nr:hypothetical protein [Paenibacillus sp. P96]MDP4099076.1 hypothetical protein [Paenibacillus sp. P96]